MLQLIRNVLVRAKRPLFRIRNSLNFDALGVDAESLSINEILHLISALSL